jgi:sporulation protein YlmC with PRC-barrel domain/hemerythrin-like domain-containing protein
MDVLDIIKLDHEMVIRIIEDLEKTTIKDVPIREDGIWEMRKLIIPHMTAEETVFYPSLDREIPDMVNKAIEEHRMLRNSLEDLSNISKDDESWIARLTVVIDLIQNHVRQEEGPIFDAARKAFNQDRLINMGKSFEEAKGFVIPDTTATVATASSRGAGAGAYAPTATSAQGYRMSGLIRSSTLKGNKVRDAHGNDLGKIEEVMIELETGRIGYMVLSFGGFLGLGDKLFAVPWKALHTDPERRDFILDVDKDQLKNAPGFDKNNWPDMTSPEWGESIHTYYGQVPYWRS